MGTDRSEIRDWFNRSKKSGALFMIVACDTFAHEDYPVDVGPGEDVEAKVNELSDPNKMSRVMEVYCLSMDREAQLAEHRAWHLTAT
jgi:hypothetical protein